MITNILIIDDQPEMLELMTDVLTPEGFNVTALLYTDDIAQSISIYQPDIVLLDHLLAGVNGGELCREIKNHPLTASLPVILLSGYPRLLEAFGDYGCDAFIPKPFDLDEMIGAIKRCLGESHYEHA
ncbi:response regulator [Mucilaginibacter sp. UR6-1]|uniref:response regulator n=1 Tax=Mucilaginibacter sp. UR6-1 TaxID=1435643 RepID=UPI001E61826D|nr:response regulator [Mucilaginibacter sp. UR6-1]MCC8407590.1 response regulator [Mucilaginibacter sp. UR6-1]